MENKIQTFLKTYKKQELPDIRPGDTVRIAQKIPASPDVATEGKKGGNKEKLQHFEGLVIAKKHGKEMGGTITLRKIVSGVGVERIFPLHSPTIDKIEILSHGKVRRAKLYYLRKTKGKRGKLKSGEEFEKSK